MADDRVGIGLYTGAIVAFAVGAIGAESMPRHYQSCREARPVHLTLSWTALTKTRRSCSSPASRSLSLFQTAGQSL